MATSKEYIEFVCEQLDGIENVTYRKMFGEYMVYVNAKPLLIVCAVVAGVAARAADHRAAACRQRQGARTRACLRCNPLHVVLLI